MQGDGRISDWSEAAASAMHTFLMAQDVASRKNSDTARAIRQEKRNREKTLVIQLQTAPQRPLSVGENKK